MMRFHFKFKLVSLTLLAAVSLTAAALAQTKPAEPAWTAKDTAGKAVTVPAADLTSVLVFVRMDQPQSRQAVTQVTALLKDKKNVQVLAITSGDDAELSANKLAKKAEDGTQWSYPVVVDPDYTGSGKFGVHVWPTTVVITKTGAQAAHIAGLPASFGTDLEAYLDFAAGKIDQAALDKRLSAHDIVADSAEQKASRHVEVAMRLAEKGLKDQAKAEIAKALDFKPADPPAALQASLVRALLTVGDATTAETILGQIKPDALPPMELNFLRGWAALQLEKWDDAKKLLTDSVKLNPQPAEACYLLGLVYQHAGDNAQAAANFRKAFEHTTLGRTLNPTP